MVVETVQGKFQEACNCLGDVMGSTRSEIYVKCIIRLQIFTTTVPASTRVYE
jgi:hypothetical protein